MGTLPTPVFCASDEDAVGLEAGWKAERAATMIR